MDNSNDSFRSTSWSTEKIERLKIAMDEGAKPQNIPFHEGKFEYKKANIVFEYTAEEIKEIRRCATDIVYFANKYCTVMTDEGVRTITLRPYQERMVKHFQDNRFSIVLASRQIGKTICSSIFVAWYLIFNFDRNALIMANKGVTTQEIIDKTKTIFENLPFFLKPGIIKNDVFGMRFDNGCRLIGQTTTKKSAIGFTIHLLFLDEFAHVDPNIVESFYENVYPTLSSSKVSRIIITSTQNGFNKFQQIYTGAEKGLNEFKHFKVDWWEIPGRDEDWYAQELKNLGSEEAFLRQYGTVFVSGDRMLLTGLELKYLESTQTPYEAIQFTDLDDIDVDYKEEFTWREDFDPDELDDPDNYFVVSIDVAAGNEGDNSIANFFKIEPLEYDDLKYLSKTTNIYDYFKLKQVGRFKSNIHSIEDFAKVVYTMVIDIMYPENIKMVLEWNTFGGEFLKNMETVFSKRNDFAEEIIVKFKHRVDARSEKLGLRLRSDNKAIYCINFKKLLGQHRFDISCKDNINEGKTFSKMANGSYAAANGTDDLIMTCVNLTEFLNSVDYQEFIEELFDKIPTEIQDYILEHLQTRGNAEEYEDE